MSPVLSSTKRLIVPFLFHLLLRVVWFPANLFSLLTLLREGTMHSGFCIIVFLLSNFLIAIYCSVLPYP